MEENISILEQLCEFLVAFDFVQVELCCPLSSRSVKIERRKGRELWRRDPEDVRTMRYDVQASKQV